MKFFLAAIVAYASICSCSSNSEQDSSESTPKEDFHTDLQLFFADFPDSKYQRSDKNEIAGNINDEDRNRMISDASEEPEQFLAANVIDGVLTNATIQKAVGKMLTHMWGGASEGAAHDGAMLRKLSRPISGEEFKIAARRETLGEEPPVSEIGGDIDPEIATLYEKNKRRLEEIEAEELANEEAKRRAMTGGRNSEKPGSQEMKNRNTEKPEPASEDPTPPKRKRGRPRKHPKPEDLTGEKPVKRKRGRPRKVRPPPEEEPPPSGE